MEYFTHHPSEPDTHGQTQEDPVAFFRAFRDSDPYKQALADFLKGKKIASDVTEGEKRQAFEQSYLAKRALAAFAATEVSFAYNPRHYPPTSINAIDEYIAYVKMIEAIKAKETPVPEDLSAMDLQRTILHIALGETMVTDGIAPTIKLGRMLGRLMLIPLGLDTYQTASEPDARAIQRE